MAGWELKEGILISESITEEKLERLIQKIIKSKKQNSYKYFLIKVVFKSILLEKFNLSLNFIIKDFVSEYLEFILNDLKNQNISEQETKNNSLYDIIIQYDFELLKDNKEKIFENNFEFLKKYMFGALYEDTEGLIFGFSKKDDTLSTNKNLKNILQIKYFKLIEDELNKWMIIEKSQNNKNGSEIKLRYYQQKFSFELQYLLKIIAKNLDEESYSEMLKKYNKNEIAEKQGIGVPKYDAQKQYLEIAGLIEKDSFTIFGEKLMEMKSNLDYIEPLVYYNMVRNPEKGGHYIFSNLVNEVLYKNYIENYDAVINQGSLVKDAKSMIEHSNIQDKDWERMVISCLGDIADPDTGFGKLGILEKIEGKEKAYEIHSYWVEPLVAAYIIYDMWEENQTTMGIEKIVNDRYNLGRMFLMDEDAVMETLEEIQALNLITIEVIAGLNQIRINPRIAKEDILDMIIKEA